MLNIALTSLALLLISVVNVPLALLTGTIPKPIGEMIEQSFLKHYNIVVNETMISTVFSAFTVAMALGNLIAIIYFLPQMDKRGRKFLAVHVRCVLQLLICLLQIASYCLPSVECYFISLLLEGLVFPTTLIAAIMMITDCSSDHWRGFFSSFPGIGTSIGAFSLSMLSQPSWIGNDKWVAIQILSFIVTSPCYLYLFCYSYESPKWLLAHKSAFVARKAVIFYQGTTADADNELCKIKKELQTSSTVQFSWVECMRDDVIRSGLVLILAISSLMDISSLNYEGMFAVTIYNTLGLPTEQALTFNSIASIVGLMLSFVGSYLLDRLGRRPMSYVMFSSMVTIDIVALENCVLGFCLMKDIMMSVALWISCTSGPSALTAVVGVLNKFLAVVYSAAGGGMLASLLIGEILPLAARVPTAQITHLLPIVLSLPLGALFPLTLTWFPPAMYLLFLIIHPIIITYIYRNLPETKNQAVCDIVADVAESVISRRNTRRSTLYSEYDGLLEQKRRNTYRSIDY